MTGKICLIGDIVVDITLKNSTSATKLRMGGIVHAARCLWAMNVPFAVRYFAPSYLTSQIDAYLKSLNCTDIEKLGDVAGSPYVFLIGEPKETGDQEYDLILREDVSIEYDKTRIEQLRNCHFDDFLVISGNYELHNILDQLNGRIHVDVANNVTDLAAFHRLDHEIETLFISTSSDIFKKYYAGSFSEFCSIFSDKARQVVLKENRGGSRHFCSSDGHEIKGFAQVRPIQHSVGVGDCFDVVFICHYGRLTISESLVLASWISAEYASTTYPDDLKTNVQRITKSNISDLANMGGVSLPWESRPSISVYLAAPDFDFVNVDPLEQIAKDLAYHNFSARRPVKENGQMPINANKIQRQNLYRKDMELMAECCIVVAVLLYNDPGTLIEIGLAVANGIPTFVYDPYKIATNCMLTEAPDIVSSDRDIIISEIFISANKIVNYVR